MLLPKIWELGSLQDPIAPYPNAHLLLSQETQPCFRGIFSTDVGAEVGALQPPIPVLSCKTGRALQK